MWIKPCSVTILWKATEQYFHVFMRESTHVVGMTILQNIPNSHVGLFVWRYQCGSVVFFCGLLCESSGVCACMTAVVFFFSLPFYFYCFDLREV